MSAIGIIPARLQSERFPNKLFALINGVPILERVINNVIVAGIMDRVIVATDSKEIVDFCDKLGQESFFMIDEVSCGSERVKYIYKAFPDYDWYVSFPADEPMLDSEEIRKMWKEHLVKHDVLAITTCWSKFYNDINRFLSLKSCKIVSSKNSALYFSRAPIPLSKNGFLHFDNYKKHIGIFIFHNDLLKQDRDMWSGELSKKEELEQIAFLENNIRVNLLEIKHLYHGVDTSDDIKSLEDKIK